MKKIISIILMLSMLMAAVPGFTAFALEDGEFVLPDFFGYRGEWFTIEDVQQYVHDDDAWMLDYASDINYYPDMPRPVISFIKHGFEKSFTLDMSPLHCKVYGQYDLSFNLPEEIEGGNYTLVVKLYTPEGKGVPAIKFVINRFVIEDNNGEYFDVYIPEFSSPAGSVHYIENFQDLVSERRQFGLLYVSGDYDATLDNATMDIYLPGGRVNTKSLSSSPLRHRLNGSFALQIPYAITAYSNVRIVFTLPVAHEKGIDDVKPYRIIIENFVAEDTSGTTFPDHVTFFLSGLKITPGETLVISNLEEIFPEYLLPALERAATPAAEGVRPSESYISFSQGNHAFSPIPTDDTFPLQKYGDNYELSIYCDPDAVPGIYTMDAKFTSYIDSGKTSRSLTITGYDVEIVAPTEKPHDCEWDEGFETMAPGCETEGEITYRCLYPGCEETRTEPIPPKGHEFGEWETLTPPTTTTPGEAIRFCPGCGSTESMEIPVSEHKNTIFNIADTVTLLPIADAEVYVSRADDEFVEVCISDTNGVADFDLENGIYSVQIIKEGYQLRNFSIEKTDDSQPFDVYLNKHDLLQVNTTVKEMTRKEIVDAGIDINAPENQHVYECTTVLAFTPAISGGSFNPTPVNIDIKYYYNEDGSVINPKPIYTPSGSVIYPVSRDIYLIVHSKTTWLKEMFDVQLVVSNTSNIENVEDCVAELELPEGLSLAAMMDGQQSCAVSFENIAPGETQEHHWYLCGDVAGEYYINGTVNGTRVSGAIKEKTSTAFTTQEAICVLGGDAMTLLIEAEKTAVVGTPYRMRYTLQNVSGKTLNNVCLSIPGGKFLSAYDVADVIHNSELGDAGELSGTFNDGYTLSDESFLPGEVLSGVFEITFGTGIDTEYITYMVKDMFNITGNNSTTEIPTNIVLVDNIDKHRWDEGHIVKNSTCTSEGEIIYSCLDEYCTKTNKVTLTVKDHDLGSWQITKEATCTTKGERNRSCKDCTYVVKGEVDPKPHTHSRGEITSAPTHTSAGTIKYHCLECGGTQTEELSLVSEDDINWKLYNNGLLVISENDTSAASLGDYASQIKVTQIEEGVTEINDETFAGSVNLEAVYIPESINSIDDGAFADCPNLKKVHFEGSRSQLEDVMSAGEIATLKDEMITYGKPSLDFEDGNIDIYAPEEEIVMIVAVYEGDTFVGLKSITVKESMQKPLEELGIGAENSRVLKAFMWKNFGDLRPLCSKDEVIGR